MKINNSFIERSIMGAISFFKDSVYADEYALKQGFLQSLDARIKSLIILLFIVLALLVKTFLPLAVLYALCLAAAVFSEIKLGYFLKRTWFFIPLFSLFIAIPAVFSVFTPGKQLLCLKIIGLKLIITQEGLSGAALFVARVAVSVSLVVVLALTTRHNELLKVLRVFKVPQIFVMTLGMCYRYIYLFVEIIEHTHTAIKSRVGYRVRQKKGTEIVTWNMANLWLRSINLNAQVYDAMLSRGYTGEPRTLCGFKAAARDWVWLVFAVIVCAALLYVNHVIA